MLVLGVVFFFFFWVPFFFFFFFFLNEPLAEVTEKKYIYIQFLPSTGRVTEESFRQDMAVKTPSLECPLAPGL